MAFGTLTIGTATFNSVGPGEYMKSTVGFGQPADMVKLTPGKKANQKAPVSAAITRIIDLDVQIPGAPTGALERKRMSASLQVNIPDGGFTTASLDAAVNDLSTLITPEFLTRLLLGES